jgi:hypothetical protein
MKANLECVLRACRAVAHVSWVPSRRARVSRTRWGAEAHVLCVRAASPTSSPRGSRRPQGQGASSCCTSFGRGGTSRRRWRRSARGRGSYRQGCLGTAHGKRPRAGDPAADVIVPRSRMPGLDVGITPGSIARPGPMPVELLLQAAGTGKRANIADAWAQISRAALRTV